MHCEPRCFGGNGSFVVNTIARVVPLHTIMVIMGKGYGTDGEGEEIVPQGSDVCGKGRKNGIKYTRRGKVYAT
jgi:hypothetical protein